jgi:hypothetical protein
LSDAVKKIKKLDRRIFESYPLVEKRAFWILCYCYFVNGKDEIIRWKQLEQTQLMGNTALAEYLGALTADGYLKHYEERPQEFYKLTGKAKELIEQQLNEAEILLQLRNAHP